MAQCSTAGCPVLGQPRRVLLRLVAPDVAELPQLVCARCWAQMWVGGDGMALARCEGCTTLYAVGLPVCPHCGSDRAHEEGTDMAKITERGPSNARAEQPPARPVPELDPPAVPPAEPVADEGGTPSPGSSSETSSERQPTIDETSGPDHPKPVRTTGSRSKRGRTGGSTARMTATPGPEVQPAEDAR